MKKILFFTFLLFTLINCTQKSNTDNFQNDVYSQIFHEIIDSCVVFTIKLDENVLRKEEYKNEMLKIRNQERLIAIYDTVSGYRKDDFDENIFKNFRTNWVKSDSSNFVININNSNIKANNTLIKASALPNLEKSFKDYKTWDEYEDLKNLDVEIFLKRIFFNEIKTEGFLQIGVICGKLCGQGYDIWIKKIDNEWKIIKIKPTWFSQFFKKITHYQSIYWKRVSEVIDKKELVF